MRPKPLKRKYEWMTVSEEERMAALRAAGCTYRDIARVLDRSLTLVQEVLQRPEVMKFVTDCRQTIRAQHIANVQQTTQQIWDKISGATEAKDIKFLTDAAHNLEKIAASASGENKPVPTVAVQTNVNVDADLADLLTRLGYSNVKGELTDG